MKKRVLSIFLAVLMLMGMLTIGGSAAGITASGTCGDNVTWSLSGGTLTISGSGDMYDYSYDYDIWATGAPWGEYTSDDITSIVIKSGVTNIGNYAFYGCFNLTDVSIPEGVTSIGQYAFSCCFDLPSVTLPESVTSIKKGAFECCDSLASINLPDNLSSIGDDAFASCYSLKSITIPDQMTKINDFVFGWCTSLTSVTIPDNITSIGNCAFSSCFSLEKVTIGSGVKSIGMWAFYDCTSLDEIYFRGNCPDLGDEYYYDVFEEVTATAYYPSHNSTWTSSKLKNYGGSLTWISYSVGYSSFTDLGAANSSNWYYDGVSYVIDYDLMNGTSSTTFEPDTTTSRAMIVTILYRLAGSPTVSGSSSFSDVVSGSWYEDAVIWATDCGVAEGYGNGLFGVNDPVTREQLAAFFYRYAVYTGCDTTDSADLMNFSDYYEVDEWAETELSWAVGAGLINGVDNGEILLQPTGSCTRAMTATILYRFSTSSSL